MSRKEMMKAVVQACRRNKIRDGYIRLVVTRGVGTLGLNPYNCKSPSVIIIADKIQLYPPAFYKRGLDLITVPTARNLHSALNPAIKSLNYLNNILAKIEAINGGCEEAIMLNAQGFVAECTGDNIFIVKGGHLSTPPLSAGALYGITRGVVMELARQNGLSVSEPTDPLRSFQRRRVFLDGHRGGNHRGGQNRRAGHRQRQAGAGYQPPH